MTSATVSERLEVSFSLIEEAGAPPGVAREQLESLTAFALVAEGATGIWEITVAIVDDARLQSLHRGFMGIDTSTDIMTFPADESAQEIQGGELVISVDHATTQGAAWGHSPEEEIAFLVVHGLLHLNGWRDATEDQRERMLARQRDLIDLWRKKSAREDC